MVFVFFLSDYLVHKDNVLKVHPCCQKCRISSFIVIEKMHKYNVKYISYFLHSFIYQWTLMLLPYLGTVNNAAMNTEVRVSFPIFFFSDISPAVELLDHMVVLFF